ncbi:GNAT family N-acetyltransferase [Streptacidiphilus sp. 4-A2]|nr:GNAT family N-acetyltransferase [Streptacidiphilus sp. 4-A2]
MSDLVPPLPPGYRARPAATDDIDSIHGLVAACEQELSGRARTDRGQIASVFARAGLVPELDTLLIHDRTGQPAARAWANRRSEIDVHPRHRGLGLGSALLEWAERRARQAGDEQIVQTLPDSDTQAVALLRSHGYGPKSEQWLLEFPMSEEPGLPEPPTGITVRPFRSGDERDAQDAHQLIQDAFGEWQQRRREFPEWAEQTVERPSFAPAASALAFAGDRLVGAALSLNLPGTGEGHIEEVAVHRDHRNRGVARLLLRHAFRAFHRQGRRNCTLATHSETGALALYLRVGMTVRDSSTVFSKHLGSV